MPRFRRAAAITPGTFLAVTLLMAAPACGQAYNPYAGAPEPPPPPLAADGTIQWGTLYKSAKLQQSYERLWNLGACRGTNKAITKPVDANKMLIDRLPEAEFHGTVKAAVGTLAGGLIAYTEDDGSNPAAPVFVAQLHPAGVSKLVVSGAGPVTALAPGLFVRLRTTVDPKGRGTEPLTNVEVITPPAGYVPDPVDPGRRTAVVGRIVSTRGKTLVIHVDAGKMRRLSFELDPQVTVRIDAAQVELVSPGDTIRLTGRMWSGDGAMGAGTVFASDVMVAKREIRAE